MLKLYTSHLMEQGAGGCSNYSTSVRISALTTFCMLPEGLTTICNQSHVLKLVIYHGYLLFENDPVADTSDLLHLDLNHIPVFHKSISVLHEQTHTTRRPGHDGRPLPQGRSPAQVRNDLFHRPDHVAGRRLLSQVPVHFRRVA